MKSEQITAKTSIKALKLLRQVAALTGEKQYQVSERLLSAELQSINNQNKKP